MVQFINVEATPDRLQAFVMIGTAGMWSSECVPPLVRSSIFVGGVGDDVIS